MKMERLAGRGLRGVQTESDDTRLSDAQTRELARRIRDLEDRTRYLLVSTMGPRVFLYYDVTEDTYVWNDPRAATLFKRRAAAAAVKKLLGTAVAIVACRVDSRGRLVVSSVQRPGKRRRAKQARTRANSI
jgi:hypothetical protein